MKCTGRLGSAVRAIVPISRAERLACVSPSEFPATQMSSTRDLKMETKVIICLGLFSRCIEIVLIPWHDKGPHLPFRSL